MPLRHTYEDLLDRLSARSGIPELDLLDLPDNWRADQTRDLQQFCATCHWSGVWDKLVRWKRIGSKRGKLALNLHDIHNSAIEGNFCCAVLFALSRKFDVTGSHEDSLDVEAIEFLPLSGLKIRGEASGIKDIYISCHGESHHAPHGARAYSYERHPSVETWSDESLAWAKSRFESCVDEHECHAFQSKEVRLPTRLVYIPKDPQTHGCATYP